MADRAGHAACTDEADRVVSVCVEVGGRQGLGARSVFKRDSRDENLEHHARSFRDRAEKKRHFHELGTVRVCVHDAVVGAVVGPHRSGLDRVGDRPAVGKAGDEPEVAVGMREQRERHAVACGFCAKLQLRVVLEDVARRELRTRKRLLRFEEDGGVAQRETRADDLDESMGGVAQEKAAETEAVELRRSPDGAVSGVLARDPGGLVEIACPRCLLCTGSLIRSERIRVLVPEFAAAKPKRYAHDMPGLTGDGLTIAERAGIALDEDSIVMAFVGCMPVAFQQTAFQTGERGDGIRVNLEGKRWVNEKTDGKAMAEALLYQPQAVSYTVLDSAILESAEPVLPPPPGAPAGPPGGFPYPGGVPDFAVQRGEKMPGTRDAFRALAERLGHQTVLCGDTLEELAEKMGVDPAAFTQTVVRYNALCEAGEDRDFGKPAPFLRPLKEGPFFAIRNYLYLDGVFGGLDVNENMQVLNGGLPVPGLYAAGDITCGRYVNDRLHKTEVINDYSWAVAGGFMAANHMIGKTQ